jgi:hypothetical protein
VDGVEQDTGDKRPSSSKHHRSKKKHKTDRQRRKERLSPMLEDFRKGLQNQIDFAHSGRHVRTGVENWAEEESKEGLIPL